MPDRLFKPNPTHKSADSARLASPKPRLNQAATEPRYIPVDLSNPTRPQGMPANATGPHIAQPPQSIQPKAQQAPTPQVQTTLPTVQPIQRQPENKTGLPGNLKSGMEKLSGMDLSDIRVHYNSSRPTKFQAHAFAQGSHIHLAPGQERYLPHEAWHVVQQKTGRVKPTQQMHGVSINDDPSLERDADVMGAKAMQWESLELNNFAEQTVSRNAPLQFKNVVPTYTGVGHSTKVEAKLVRGDTMNAGSPPSAAVTGFDKLVTLGLTQGADNDHRWVKFHVLNQQGGGDGSTAANLTPASQTANHTKAWNSFEKRVKQNMENAHEMDGQIHADSVKFDAQVGYHPARTVYWKKGDGTLETTDSSHYPNTIDADLAVQWAEIGLDRSYSANLTVADGLFRPEDHPDPNWTPYANAARTVPI